MTHVKGKPFQNSPPPERGVGKTIGERRVWQDTQAHTPQAPRNLPRDSYHRGNAETLNHFPANASVQRGARRFGGSNPYQHPAHFVAEAGLKQKNPLNDEQSLRLLETVIGDKRLHTPRAISKAIQEAAAKKRIA